MQESYELMSTLSHVGSSGNGMVFFDSTGGLPVFQ